MVWKRYYDSTLMFEAFYIRAFTSIKRDWSNLSWGRVTGWIWYHGTGNEQILINSASFEAFHHSLMAL
jgi:hypothetical protein